MKEIDETIFWADGWKGHAKGGCYIRCDIKKVLKDFIKRTKVKIVGIRLDLKDPDWNLELFIDHTPNHLLIHEVKEEQNND